MKQLFNIIQILLVLTFITNNQTLAQWPGGPPGFPYYTQYYFQATRFLTIGLTDTLWQSSDIVRLPVYGSITNVNTFNYSINGDSLYLKQNGDTIWWVFDVVVLRNGQEEILRWSNGRNFCAGTWSVRINFLRYLYWIDTLYLPLPTKGRYQVRLLPKVPALEAYTVSRWITITEPTPPDTNRQTPIIFVPGIMASSLCDSTATKEEYLWIDSWRLALPGDLFLLPLQLANNGRDPMFPSYNIRVSPRTNGAYTPKQELERKPLSYYKKMFDSLTINYGYKLDNFDANHTKDENLFVFAYDWRRSIEWSGEQLSYFIDSVNAWLGTNQVKIITHSMGGLVTKECVRRFEKNRIREIINVATPHLGAPKIEYVMFNGNLLGLLGVATNYDIMKALIKNMPSAYQLMPSPNYFNIELNNGLSAKIDLYDKCFSQYQQPLNYDQTIDFFAASKTILGTPEFNSYLLDQLPAFHQNLANVDFGNIRLFNIAGHGLPTIGQVKFWGTPIGERATADHNLNGDGTVPLRSAEIVNESISKADYYVKGVKHSELLDDESVINLIGNLLQSPPDTLSPLNTKISKQPPTSYAFSTLSLIIGSPVTINIYDSQERHTGPINDSTWETNIPESYYQAGPLLDPESPKVIFVPPGDDYRVEISSQDTAAHFSLIINEIQNGQLIGSTTFDSIATDNNTRARLQLNKVTSDLLLEVDLDGDLNYETKVHPSIVYIAQTINEGWNLLSLPLQPLDSSRVMLYPSAVSNIFIYDGSYKIKDTLSTGKGFWLKFNSPDTIYFRGLTNFSDTIEVVKGWNIIGSPTGNVLVSSVQSEPTGIITSAFYKYQENYQATDTLKPGLGYWVKVNTNGQLILNSNK